MTTTNTQISKIKTAQDLIKSQFPKMAASLPKHINPDRMLRIYLTEVAKNPKLSECTRDSLIGALIQSGQLGLEPGNGLGHCYLIPYKNNKHGTHEAQFQIGYRGMIDLARRSGNIVSLSAHEVFSNDTFEFEYGLTEKLRHIPNQVFEKDKEGKDFLTRGHLMCVYAIAQIKGGGHQFEVMFKSDIDKIRARSKTSGAGPWVSDYEEMAKKTVIRKLFKMLPSSIEIQQAVILDEAEERGEQKQFFDMPEGALIDGETGDQIDPETGEVVPPKTQAEKVAEEI